MITIYEIESSDEKAAREVALKAANREGFKLLNWGTNHSKKPSVIVMRYGERMRETPISELIGSHPGDKFIIKVLARIESSSSISIKM